MTHDTHKKPASGDGELPRIPRSQWDGDSRYTWLGKPFEYTKEEMRDYGRKCFEAALRYRDEQEKQA